MTPEPFLPEILRLHGPDGVLAYPVSDDPDREMTIAGANDTLCALLRYTPQELLALTPADVIADFATLTTTGFGPFETDNRLIEHALVTRNGDQVPVEIRSHVVHVDGRNMNVVAVRDIRSRIRSRRLEQQGEKCFRTIFGLSRSSTSRSRPS